MTVDKKYRKIAQWLARYGCVSIGLVYVLLGSMAILSLFGRSEDDADEERALDYLLEYTLGEILVWVVLIGMVGYITWRVFEAITDPYEFGKDLKGIGKRVGVALSGVGYGLIAFSAYEVLNGGGGNSEEEQQLMIARILAWDAGPWLVGAAGVVTMLTGLVQFQYVIQGAYNKRLDLGELEQHKKRIIHTLAWAGYFARGIILLVLGYFLLRGAIKQDENAVGDTDSAFDFIGGGTVGDTAFFLVALGTICYGFFMFIFSVFYKFRRD
ncbi:DUF1206 domain-containing protein [Pontibacter sp. BAB1700]|uniref:DUF1206 domain-containing protein n=1 Tax=Pontibacter sp. BAB1700 TaxID=1144253 RepID=UPI00026BC202|nr:DUF1206 domain-containing protein [Pontibacter sp. BAB1700]EJF08660.1 hypothetical protein O71_19475 [Pontibacter sp. BAB1700]